jgi:tRNA(fMet)-specific endonuclease VapC
MIINRKSDRLLNKIIKQRIGDIGISTITLSELHYGIEKSQYKEKNLEALTGFLLPFEIVPFDDMAAQTYGSIRTALEHLGKLIGSMDMLIAAHALSLGLTLITNNTREFSRVEKLSIADWA